MCAEESRVLVVAPVGQDAEAMAAMLRQEGVIAEACAGAGECAQRLERGAGAVVLTEEALELPGAEELLGIFERQPAWSELPLIILTSGGESRFERLLEIASEVAGGITVLERPMSARTLLHSVQVALRSRSRQYQVRDLLAERERREEALRESEAKLRAVIEGAPLAVAMTGPSGEILLRNPRFDQLWGRPPHATTARTYSEVYEGYHLDGRRIESDEWPAARALLKGETVENDVCEIVQADGQRITCWFGAVPIRSTSGEIVGTVCVFRDITRERRIEQALRELHQRLEYHIQNTPLAVVEFDAELRVSAWSQGAERIFGWKAAEVIGRSMWEIPWVCEENRQQVEQIAAGLQSGQTPRSASPNRNLRKDGKLIWCEWYNSCLTDAQGKMRSIQSLVLDVTARKEAEAVLARDKEELERLVAERTADLRELVGELEHFSYSITHDMRAPLRAMMGFGEAAKELCSGSGQEEQKAFLERIQTAARRMDLLITDALNYSKAVRSELPLAPVDVGRLLRGMVHTYPELQGAQEGIRIEPELPLVMGNEAGLTQCFSNLLGNAVKFVKPGEAPQIRVWAETRAEALNSQPQQWVRIWVEDRGIGIGPKMLRRVFDMFARGASEQAGTGIGLALVRKVVARMGGRVGVESEAGRGSKFWVELRSGDVRRSGAG